MSTQSGRSGATNTGDPCPLSLFVRANRRLALDRRTDGVTRPRFGPRVATAHYRAFALSVRGACRLLHAHDPGRYTDADPLAIRWVDPGLIRRMSAGTGREYGSVVGGDWDRNWTPIEEDLCFRSMRRHFLEDVPWGETRLFGWFRDRIEAGDPTAWPYDRYKSRFGTVDDLYRRIKRDGYRSQRELFAAAPSDTLRHNNDCLHPYLNEVGVDIDRDGRLLWRSGGRHRLFIAKLREVPAIPVKVWSRHRQWQQVRKRSGEGAPPAGHPDIHDVKMVGHRSGPARVDSR